MDFQGKKGWSDYELIDTGEREKLERFGKYILIRPEPQAVWGKSLPEEEWTSMAHARFTRGKSRQSAVPPRRDLRNAPIGSRQSGFTDQASGMTRDEERGLWEKRSGMPDQWIIGYDDGEMSLKFRLGLTSFGHIGAFPEQAENWRFIYDAIMDRNKRRAQGAGRRAQALHAEAERRHGSELRAQGTGRRAQGAASPADRRASSIKVLNLFAYTGGSSLAARAAGAEVVHVDSVKQVIGWAREDMELSGLDDIRWVVEDALKFVRREVKRGNRYDGIILDPPAYGRGPEGEKWVLEEYIDEMVSLCAELLRAQSTELRIPDSSFFIISLYSMGFSSLIGENLLKTHFGDQVKIQSGELHFTDRAGRKLPLGTFARF